MKYLIQISLTPSSTQYNLLKYDELGNGSLITFEGIGEALNHVDFYVKITL